MEEEAVFVYERLSPLLAVDEGTAAAALDEAAPSPTDFIPVDAGEESRSMYTDNATAAAAAADVRIPTWDEPEESGGDEVEYISLGTDEEEEQGKDISPVLANVDPELLNSSQGLY